MNRFLQASISAINRHGSSCTYVSQSAPIYNIETKKAQSTSTEVTVTMYKKHLKANQYNYPNLVGKDAAMFYLANNSLTFSLKINDKIVSNGVEYTVDAFYEHVANGQVVMYRILAVKG